ncbi:MAG: NAD+ synthase [Candidatus Omnitrophica bacterium]|nr:NAD+ synthase [Candidatus Omnitrophota bacterium]
MILRIAMAQINSWLGDFKYNTDKIYNFINKAKAAQCDIVIFPELAIPGYPPEDLIYKKDFLRENKHYLDLIRDFSKDIGVVVGFVEEEKGKIYNSAAFIYNRRLCGVYRKMHLPNYGVFDEKRYFSSGADFKIYDFGGVKIGLDICEDIWEGGPIPEQAKAGSSIIFAINASPFHQGKMDLRMDTLKEQAKENKVYIAYTNLVGGQDELIFDGRSILIDTKGKTLVQGKAFAEDLCLYDIDPKSLPKKKVNHKKLVRIPVKRSVIEAVKEPLTIKESAKLDPAEEIYKALVLGLRDYVLKNSFKKVVLGLSGGIDSALVSALAMDALGKENVIGVFMPSQFTSGESKEDALAVANNLGINIHTISIQDIFLKYLEGLAPQFQGTTRGIAEENVQARIRGNILMALSNKFGWLVLTTGNKSEISVGYTTLYGDAAGGFAPIKDVPKTLVYELARYRNSLSRPIIPERVFSKAPTAELRENQKDQDTLPPYEVLDPILKAYIEDEKSLDKIVASGFDREVVKLTIEMVDKNEYKRRQSAPGIKITPKAFGRDRRMPITNRFKQF